MKEPSRRVAPWETTRRLGGPTRCMGGAGGSGRPGQGKPGLVRGPLRATGQPTGRLEAATAAELTCLVEALGQLYPREMRVQLVHDSSPVRVRWSCVVVLGSTRRRSAGP